MDTINASSIPVNGLVLTWKKRIHTHLIYERLDIAIGPMNRLVSTQIHSLYTGVFRVLIIVQ